MEVKLNEMGGLIVLALSIFCLTACTGIYPANRPSLWVDVYNGEPARFGDVITDLETVDVIYLGERHTLQRHHDLQTRIVGALLDNNVAFALGLEQLEAWQQPPILLLGVGRAGDDHDGGKHADGGGQARANQPAKSAPLAHVGVIADVYFAERPVRAVEVYVRPGSVAGTEALELDPAGVPAEDLAPPGVDLRLAEGEGELLAQRAGVGDRSLHDRIPGPSGP